MVAFRKVLIVCGFIMLLLSIQTTAIGDSAGENSVSPTLFAQKQLQTNEKNSSEDRDSKGTVYIYRNKKFSGSLVKWQLNCNNKPVAKLSNGSYAVLELEPGEYLFNVDGKNPRVISLGLNETRYLEAKPKWGFVETTYILHEVEDNQAASIVKKLKPLSLALKMAELKPVSSLKPDPDQPEENKKHSTGAIFIWLGYFVFLFFGGTILYYLKRVFTRPNIQKMLAQKDIGGLEHALFYKKNKYDSAVNYIRSNAAVALCEIGNINSIRKLAQALNDNSDRVIQASAQAIGEIGYRLIRQPLFEINRSRNELKLQEYLSLLSKVQGWVIQPLTGAYRRLSDPQTVLYALGMIAGPRAADFIEAILQMKQSQASHYLTALQALVNTGDPRAFDALLRSLKNADDKIKIYALEMLGNYRDQRAVGNIINLIFDPNSEIRTTAAQSMAKLGQTQWSQWVKGDDDDFARLGDSNHPQKYDLLKKALMDNRLGIKIAAVKGLAKLADELVINDLENEIDNENPELKIAVIEALTKLKAVRSVAVIRNQLTVESELVRLAAAEALADFGETRWREIIRGDSNDLKRLAASGEKYAAELLLKALEQNDIAHLKLAAEALGELGDALGIEPLLKLLPNSEGSLKTTIVKALGKIGGPKALYYLLEELEKNKEPSIIEVLGDFGDPQAIPSLINSVVDSDPEVRRTTAAALNKLGEDKWEKQIRGDQQDIIRLGKLKDSRLIDPLLRAVSGDYPYRNEAILALSELGDQRAVPLLHKELVGIAPESRKIAAQALKQLGELQWEDCIRGDDDDYLRLAQKGHTGVIRELIDWLSSELKSKRLTAARSLIKLAVSPDKELIDNWSKVASLINAPHGDTHNDINRTSDCSHTDYHTDYGIGLSFPKFYK